MSIRFIPKRCQLLALLISFLLLVVVPFIVTLKLSGVLYNSLFDYKEYNNIHSTDKNVGAGDHSLQSSPQQITYNFTAAVCVCIADAEAYFEEWVDYHLAMGFQNIYIYDDSLTFELERWYQNSRNHPVYSRVIVIHYDRTLDKDEEKKNIQNFVYGDCVNRFGKQAGGPKHDYFAFIDIDEFLVLQDTKTYSDIRGVLNDYLVPFGGALTVNWMLFGSANKTIYSPLPVSKRFQYRSNTADTIVKTIAKTSDYIRSRNPHAVTIRSEKDVHTTSYPGAIQTEANTPKGVGATDKNRPSNVILLYHYRYTSTKEYIFKRCVRGQMDRGNFWCSKNGTGVRSDNTPKHIQEFPGTVFDDIAWRFLKSRVPKYRIYDEFDDFN